MTSTPDQPGRTTLEISVQPHGQTVILAATGEVDMVSAPQLEESARGALEDAPPVLVLDLSGVTFLSSAGLTILVRTQKLAHGQTDLRIVAAGPATLRPLQLMGLDQDLAVYPTREEAVTGPPSR